jgi:hypothetical protein
MDDRLTRFAEELAAEFRYVTAADERFDTDSVLRTAPSTAPVFILRAKDRLAVATIDFWLMLAESYGLPAEKLASARRQREAFARWVERELPMPPLRGAGERPRTAEEELGEPDSVLARMHPREPIFVLSPADFFAGRTVQFWAWSAMREGTAPEKVRGALAVAKAMDEFPGKRIVGRRALVIETVPGDEEDGLSQAPARGNAARRGPGNTAYVTALVCKSCGYSETLVRGSRRTPEANALVQAALGENCPGCGQDKTFMLEHKADQGGPARVDTSAASAS